MSILKGFNTTGLCLHPYQADEKISEAVLQIQFCLVTGQDEYAEQVT